MTWCWLPPPPLHAAGQVGQALSPVSRFYQHTYSTACHTCFYHRTRFTVVTASSLAPPLHTAFHRDVTPHYVPPDADIYMRSTPGHTTDILVVTDHHTPHTPPPGYLCPSTTLWRLTVHYRRDGVPACVDFWLVLCHTYGRRRFYHPSRATNAVGGRTSVVLVPGSTTDAGADRAGLPKFLHLGRW